MQAWQKYAFYLLTRDMCTACAVDCSSSHHVCWSIIRIAWFGHCSRDLELALRELRLDLELWTYFPKTRRSSTNVRKERWDGTWTSQGDFVDHDLALVFWKLPFRQLCPDIFYQSQDYFGTSSKFDSQFFFFFFFSGIVDVLLTLTIS